jgi:glycosyltransferase involved in cell wall biosynthesis
MGTALGGSDMSSQPLVSVITPFFNAEKFIQEAIDSVVSQTYDVWELLLVDDGSNDTSTGIALASARQAPGKIHYIQHDGHQNHGACASRNLGIRHARGQYIAFLDADDIWLPDKLAQQVTILRQYPEAGMVYGPSIYYHSWTGNPQDRARDHVPDLGLSPDTLVKSPRLLTVTYPLGHGASPCPSNIMVRPEIIERIDGFEDSWTGMYQLFEDQAFLAKVYANTTVYVSGEHWHKYRQHADSCVSRVHAAGQYHAVRLFFLNWLQEYLSTQGIKDPEVWKALERALWPYSHPILSRLSRYGQHLIRRGMVAK